MTEHNELPVFPEFNISHLTTLGNDGGLYGESRWMDAGGELVAEPGGGGLFDFFGLVLVTFVVPFCCCCCCCLHFALRFLNHT